MNNILPHPTTLDQTRSVHNICHQVLHLWTLFLTSLKDCVWFGRMQMCFFLVGYFFVIRTFTWKLEFGKNLHFCNVLKRWVLGSMFSVPLFYYHFSFMQLLSVVLIHFGKFIYELVKLEFKYHMRRVHLTRTWSEPHLSSAELFVNRTNLIPIEFQDPNFRL